MSGEDLRSTRDTGRKERNPVASGIFAEPSSPRDEVGCKKKRFWMYHFIFLMEPNDIPLGSFKASVVSVLFSNI